MSPFDEPRRPSKHRRRKRRLGPFAGLALGAYKVTGRLAAPFVRANLGRRVKAGKEDPARKAERFGRTTAERPYGPLVWIHAASVGEAHAVMGVAEAIRERGIRVLFTTGTRTSAAIVAERLGEGVIHQYAPLDLGPSLTRFLDHWQPDLAITAESEIWPLRLMMLVKRDIPSLLVNARMSDKSFARWRRMGPIRSTIMGCFTHIAARTAEDGRRFEELGAPLVTVTGDLKAEVVPPRATPQVKAQFREQVEGRTRWAAISTHADEEAMAGRIHATLRARYPRLLTVVVPRHPERGVEIEAILVEQGLRVVRRSTGERIEAGTDVFVGDTIGEMGLYLRLARTVFVGRSLSTGTVGGQNPLEPAMLGRQILHGPAIDNFRDVYAALDAGGGATMVPSENELRLAVHRALADSEAAVEAGRKASDTVAGMRGPLAATLRVLGPFIEPLGLRRSLIDADTSRTETVL